MKMTSSNISHHLLSRLNANTKTGRCVHFSFVALTHMTDIMKYYTIISKVRGSFLKRQCNQIICIHRLHVLDEVGPNHVF